MGCFPHIWRPLYILFIYSSPLPVILFPTACHCHVICLAQRVALPGLSQFDSVAQSCLNLQPHGLQHTRLRCPSPTLRACSNSCPLSRWCHPTILILCHPLLYPPSIFPSIRVFSNESVLYIRWPKYWSFSFSISPSNEYSGLISFRIDWFDLLAAQGPLKSLH